MLSLTEKEVDLIATQLLKGNVCFQEHALMQDFVDRRVKERSLAEDLVSALSKPKAITAFRFLLDGSKYKDEWAEFLRGKYQDWIKEQVDSFNYAED